MHLVASSPLSAKNTSHVKLKSMRILFPTMVLLAVILPELDGHLGSGEDPNLSYSLQVPDRASTDLDSESVPWSSYSKAEAESVEELLSPSDPNSPDALASWPVSKSQINLQWPDRANSETGYVVRRRSGWEGQWIVVTDALPPNEETFADTGLEAETEYFYRVSARVEGVDLSSELARAVTDDRPFGSRTVAFQNGINGYDGTKDVGIIQVSPLESALDPYVWVVQNGFRDEFQALLSFDQIVGESPEQIPPGARITGAYLRIYLGAIQGADCDDPILFHRMLVPWDETSTWNSEPWGENGIKQGTHTDRIPEFNTTFPFARKYYDVEMNISSLQARADGEEDFGWLIRAITSDSWAYFTSHNPIVSQRPALFVHYDTDPENRAPEVQTVHSPQSGASELERTAVLELTVTDPNSDLLDATFFGRKLPLPGDDFTVVLLPDTQYYSGQRNGGTQQIFYKQTDWIVENQEALNIAFVLHMGDVVQSGDSSQSQWVIASRAMYRIENPETTGLEDGIPYTIAVGNHDQQPRGDPDGTTAFFNRYFGVDHFQDKSYYGGHYGNNNDNNYELFDVGPHRFISITLEYRTTVDPVVLQWADELLKTHSDRQGIVTTHYLIDPQGAWSDFGRAAYEELRDNLNLKLMFGGHRTGEAWRSDTRYGNTIHSFLQDYQGWTDGGNGYLRILTFSPKSDEIHLSTYSPWVDRYNSSGFSVPHDLSVPGPEFEVLAEVSASSGDRVSFEWTGLELDREYEWYVALSDGRKSMELEPMAFSTVSPYSRWIRTYLPDDDPDLGRNADPDADGYANLLEFFFASNPLEGAYGEKLPTFVQIGDQRSIRYHRRQNAMVEWVYEVSKDLAQWEGPNSSEMVIIEQVEDNGDGTETVIIDIEDQDPALFWRIVVE